MSYAWDYGWDGYNLLTLGDKPENIIPQTLTGEATYTFKFQLLPEERLKENKSTYLFWYGCGFYHDHRGMGRRPLFIVYLNADDNHLYIYFGGSTRLYGNIYPFGSWEVDLGDARNYEKWTQFTLWLNMTNLSFKKVVIGNIDVPFPTGYDELKPNLPGAPYMPKDHFYKGILIPNLAGSNSTNVSMVVDDVEFYTEWFLPKPPGGPPIMVWMLGLGFLSLGVGLILMGKEKLGL